MTSIYYPSKKDINKNTNIVNTPLEETKRTFYDSCKDNHVRKNVCKDGLLVNIYVGLHKIFIFSGSVVLHNVANSKFKDKVIEEMKPYVRRSDFYNSFITAIDSLNKEVHFKGANPNVNNNIRNTNINTFHHNNNHGHFLTNKPPKHKNNNDMPRNNNIAILISLIGIVALIVCICYFITAKTNDKSETPEDEKRNNNYAYENEPKYNKKEVDEIREHLQFLMKILDDIKTAPNQTLQIDFCLICMKNFDTRKDNNITVKRFPCGHIFHHECCEEYKVCLLCKGDPNQNINTGNQNTNIPNYNELNNQIPPQNNNQLINFNNNINQNQPQLNNNPYLNNNNYQPQYSNFSYVNPNNVNNAIVLNCQINEPQVRRFIQNLKDIYELESLKAYHTQYPKEVEKIRYVEKNSCNNKDSKDDGSAALWGFAAGACIGGLVGHGIGSSNNHHQPQVVNNNFYGNNHSGASNQNYQQANYNNQQYNNNNNNDGNDYDGDAAEGEW